MELIEFISIKYTNIKNIYIFLGDKKEQNIFYTLLSLVFMHLNLQCHETPTP